MKKKKQKQRPSILIVNRVYPPMRGATGRMMHDLARNLIANGYKVTILATAPDGAGVKSKGPVSIVRVAGDARPTAFGYARGLWRLYRAMMRLPRHDVVITMTDPPLLYVAGDRVARKKGCRHIHWSQDLYPDLFPVLGFDIPAWILSRMKTRGFDALSRADRIVAISKCMARRLVHAGHDAGRIKVIENWPDLELDASRKKDGEERELEHAPLLKRRRLRSDPRGQKFRVLYAGSIGRAHPVDAVIEAARILQKTHRDVELAFAGKGEGFDRLADARAAYDLDNIRLLPPQPRARLKALMDSGDVHLITMLDDAAGMLLPCKFYSGLATHRPIIFAGPAECDIAHILTRFGCGKVVKPSDGKGLATAIAQYRTDADTWFAAHEAAAKATVDRMPDQAFAAWRNVIRQVLE